MEFGDLFRPKWRHSEWGRRLAAVRELKDQSILVQIVRNDADGRVREAAVGKVTDESVLTQIARTDRDPQVRKAAVEKLTDESVLTQIARTDGDSQVRRSAVGGVTDQDTLIDIVARESDARVALAAVELLADPEVLIHFARNHRDLELRAVAARRIADPALQAALCDGIEALRQRREVAERGRLRGDERRARSASKNRGRRAGKLFCPRCRVDKNTNDVDGEIVCASCGERLWWPTSPER
jgi:hypothetical protein